MGEIIIPKGRKIWLHELRVAEVLATAGHRVEFIYETTIKTADILVDGITYEIKSPERFNPNTLEHTLRNALKQSPNIIIDTSRIKKAKDTQIQRFLIRQVYQESRIKRLLLITKHKRIIDIMQIL